MPFEQYRMKRKQAIIIFFFFVFFVNLDRQPLTTVFQNSVSYCVKARSRFSHYHNHKWVHAMTYKRLNAHDYIWVAWCARENPHIVITQTIIESLMFLLAQIVHTHTHIYHTGFRANNKKKRHRKNVIAIAV